MLAWLLPGLIALALPLSTIGADIVPLTYLPSGGSWENKVGVPGGIPHRTTIFTNLTTAKSLSDCNAAIAACPSNQVVFFTNGTFNFSGQLLINNSYITIRGNGPDKTFFNVSSDTDAHVQVRGTDFADPNTDAPAVIHNWVGNYTQFTNVLKLDSVSSLSVGQMLMIDQKQDFNFVHSHGAEDCDYCGRELGERVQLQISTITNITGTNVTIDPPVYMPNWSGSLDPEIWIMPTPIRMTGIEDLTITNSIATDSGSTFNLQFKNAQSCWAYNVHSYRGRVNHFRTYLASQCEVRHCYMFGTISAASQSYGVTWYWNSGGLCIDNIFNAVTSPMLNGGGSCGNVDAFNYVTNQLYFNPNWLIEGTGHHGSHGSFDLYEGNWIPNIYWDFIHGSGSHHGAFRNRIEGWEPGKTLDTFCIAIQATNRNSWVVGNSLGRPGYHTEYEWANEDAGSDSSIFIIGFFDTSGTFDSTYDATTYTSLVRGDNWNSFNNTIPAGEADGTYPSSYLLSAKPTFFGTCPWPPFGPSGTYTNTSTRTNIPAGWRFVQGYPFTNDPPAAAGGSSVTNLVILGGGFKITGQGFKIQ